jgi:hypothetical protein
VQLEFKEKTMFEGLFVFTVVFFTGMGISLTLRLKEAKAERDFYNNQSRRLLTKLSDANIEICDLQQQLKEQNKIRNRNGQNIKKG